MIESIEKTAISIRINIEIMMIKFIIVKYCSEIFSFLLRFKIISKFDDGQFQLIIRL